MGFYYHHIVTHLVNLAMRNRLLKAYRERIVGLAEGRVLEIGIGSGMNLSFYTARARSSGSNQAQSSWVWHHQNRVPIERR